MEDSARIVDDLELLDAGDAPVHAVIAAAGAKPPRTRAPRSVFELGETTLPLCRLVAGLAPARVIAAQPVTECRRDIGTVRCVGARYPDNRWTPARFEEEARRRAKQRPPKPTSRFKAKRKSKKLLDLAGDDLWD